jgi:hypothetical protein
LHNNSDDARAQARDKDDGMMTLYQKYRANLSSALAYADAQAC